MLECEKEVDKSVNCCYYCLFLLPPILFDSLCNLQMKCGMKKKKKVSKLICGKDVKKEKRKEAAAEIHANAPIKISSIQFNLIIFLQLTEDN